VWHVLQNPEYQGQAAYGKTHMTPRGKKVSTASSERTASGASAKQRASRGCSGGVGYSYRFRPWLIRRSSRSTRGEQKSRSARTKEAGIPITRTDVLRKMWLCLLRQDDPTTRGRPSNGGFRLLPMQRLGWLPVWW
jgi:hypothetical protein